MTMKNKTARWSNSKHRWLGLIGGISLFIWGLSGLAHIALVLLGPQQATFMPPRAAIELTGARPISDILAQNGIGEAVVVKTVAGPEGAALWQVTQEPAAPRRYFAPQDGAEIAGGDRAQAEFIARHFLQTDAAVSAARLQTKFDANYPWVNRLLPVWKLEFASEDNLTAYVHTETSSLAAVNNTTKTRLQGAFRILHSWEWVPESMDWLRVIVMGLLVGSLFALAATGVMMLVSVRRKSRAPGARGWHRLAGYVLALPLIMFSASGIYHLVQSALVPAGTQLRMGEPINVSSGAWPIEEDWATISKGRAIAGVSLVRGADGGALYRVALASHGTGGPGGSSGGSGGAHDHGGGGGDNAGAKEHGAMARPALDKAASAPSSDAEIREARFAGIKPDSKAIYINAATGELSPSSETEMVTALATAHSGAGKEAIRNIEEVTRFSHEYDFRNKRLPVWRVDYAEPVKASLFVDPASGVLVDKVADWEKPERLFFSMVHKWNFLFPIGRLNLNLVVGGFVIALLVFMAALGLRMDLKRRRLSARK